MEIINQLAAPLAQSVTVVRQQTTDKAEQIRRAQVLKKNVANEADAYEHQVESTEEVAPIHDSDRKQSDQNKKPPHPKEDESEEPPHIDVKV